MNDKEINSTIETFKDLKTFFYESLSQINKKSLTPIPESTLLYSCDVLEKYSLSADFFDVKENGKVSDKILGFNLLEAQTMELEKQKEIYKDVGDTALVLVGYFSNSINTKLLDKKYYIRIGKMAYQKIDKLYPDYLDIPGFYRHMSQCFEGVTHLLKVFSEKNKQDPFKHLLLDDSNEDELLVRGITPNKKKLSS